MTSAGIVTTTPRRLGAREHLAVWLLPVFEFVVVMRSVPAIAGLLVCVLLVCVSDRWRLVDKIVALLIVPATTVALLGSVQFGYVCNDLLGSGCAPATDAGDGTFGVLGLFGMPILLALRARRPVMPRESRERIHVDAAVVLLLVVVMLMPLWVSGENSFYVSLVMIPTLVVLAISVTLLWRSAGWHPRDKGVATAIVAGCLAAQVWLHQTPWRLCADYPPDFVADHYGVACQTATETAGVLRWTVYVAALVCAAYLYVRRRP